MIVLWSLTLLLLVVVSCVGARVIPKANDYHVIGLEKYGAKDKMYAGLMPLQFEENQEGSFFFWLVKQRNRNENIPQKLVIWLNGGPGCSSMVGMMWENGPFRIELGGGDVKYNFVYNNYSWNEIADVLYVEQPIRVGYSPAAHTADIIRNEGQIGRDFRHFLLSFLAVFPEYKGREIHLSGESYAGFYIPWIASTVVLEQMKKGTNGVYERDISLDGINLAGIAIGNGVLDYLHQEPSYAEYAYSHGLIPKMAKDYLDFQFTTCLEDLMHTNTPLTRGSFDKCNMLTKVLEVAGKPNEYNTATFNPYDRIQQKNNAFDQFFQDEDIQIILHVRGKDLPGVNFIPENFAGEEYKGDYYPKLGWSVCNDKINSAMNRDHPTSAVPTLQFLADFSSRYPHAAPFPYDPPHLNGSVKMEGHIKVLLYSGEFDLNCNTLGTLHTLEANYWRKRAWRSADRSLWKFNNDVAGEYLTLDEVFSFLIVRNSGHLLPMDLPANALDMLDRFINGRSFADVPLPSEESYAIPELLQAVGNNEAKEGLAAGDGEESKGGMGMMVLAFLLIALLVVVYDYKKRAMVNKISEYEAEESRNEEERQRLSDERYYQSNSC